MRKLQHLTAEAAAALILNDKNFETQKYLFVADRGCFELDHLK
jgi:hypothetical protein